MLVPSGILSDDAAAAEDQKKLVSDQRKWLNAGQELERTIQFIEHGQEIWDALCDMTPNPFQTRCKGALFVSLLIEIISMNIFAG